MTRPLPVLRQGTERDSVPLYDAFISYSHAKDKPVAAALQSVIQKLGKPWYKRRALRVFRDDTSLSATPHLWPSIEKALAESRYLILLASPEAAASPWIAKEVSYWLANKSPDTLFIGLTHGELAWNAKSGDFDWSDSTPLPDILKGRFASEPKWVDLRVYRDGANPRNAHLVELGADFAAAIRGMPKEDLLSQELRQQRRALTLAMGAAASLLVLAAAAAWQWTTAEIEKTRAQEQLRQAQINESKFLDARAREAADNGDVDLAKTLLSMSMPTNFRAPDRPLVATKNAAIPAILERDALVAILHGHKRAVDTVAFSPDGKRAITASWDDTIRIWNAATGEPLLALPGQELQAATLSPDASQILTTEDDFKARLWDATSGKLLRTLTYGDEQVSGAAFSSDGKLVFTTLHDGRTRIWDLPSGQSLHVLDGSALAFSPDSRLIVAASSDNIARIWDVATGQVSNVLRLDEESEFGARHWITTAVFSSDGTRVLAAVRRGSPDLGGFDRPKVACLAKRGNPSGQL